MKGAQPECSLREIGLRGPCAMVGKGKFRAGFRKDTKLVGEATSPGVLWRPWTMLVEKSFMVEPREDWAKLDDGSLFTGSRWERAPLGESLTPTNVRILEFFSRVILWAVSRYYEGWWEWCYLKGLKKSSMMIGNFPWWHFTLSLEGMHCAWPRSPRKVFLLSKRRQYPEKNCNICFASTTQRDGRNTVMLHHLLEIR